MKTKKDKNAKYKQQKDFAKVVWANKKRWYIMENLRRQWTIGRPDIVKNIKVKICHGWVIGTARRYWNGNLSEEGKKSDQSEMSGWYGRRRWTLENGKKVRKNQMEWNSQEDTDTPRVVIPTEDEEWQKPNITSNKLRNF